MNYSKILTSILTCSMIAAPVSAENWHRIYKESGDVYSIDIDSIEKYPRYTTARFWAPFGNDRAFADCKKKLVLITGIRAYKWTVWKDSEWFKLRREPGKFDVWLRTEGDYKATWKMPPYFSKMYSSVYNVLCKNSHIPRKKTYSDI